MFKNDLEILTAKQNKLQEIEEHLDKKLKGSG